MSKKEVERFLIAGGEDKNMRPKYNAIEAMSNFVAAANEEGYDFTEEDLMAVLQENGDTFESYGNPRMRDIWWY